MYESKKVMVSYAKDDFGTVDAIIKTAFDISIYPAWVLEEVNTAFRSSASPFPALAHDMLPLDLCIILFSQQYLAVCSDYQDHYLWKMLLQRERRMLFVFLDPSSITLMQDMGVSQSQILNGETNSCKNILLNTARILNTGYQIKYRYEKVSGTYVPERRKHGRKKNSHKHLRRSGSRKINSSITAGSRTEKKRN